MNDREKPTSDSPKGGPADHPAVEVHRGLRTLFDELEEARDRESLLTCVVTLEKELSPHFTAEESAGGMFETIRERAPNSAHRVAALISEHGEIMKCLSQLREELEESEEEPSAELQRTAWELCAKCKSHEADEMELLVDALYTDISASD